MALISNNGIKTTAKTKEKALAAKKMDAARPPNKSYPYAVINGKERKLTRASAYFLDMITKS